MKLIDIETWPRKQIYQHFMRFAQPHINACTMFDVTNAQLYCKELDIPMFRFLLYAALKAANEVLEFKYRIRKDAVIEHKSIGCSFTVQTASKVIDFAWTDYKDSLSDFLREIDSEVLRIERGEPSMVNPERDDVMFLGCTPWSSFTSLSHPLKSQEDSIPRFTWGKYLKEDGKVKMPGAITVHHSLVDGYHLGAFDQLFQDYLSNPQKLK